MNNQNIFKCNISGTDITLDLLKESQVPEKCISDEKKIEFEYDKNYTTPVSIHYRLIIAFF